MVTNPMALGLAVFFAVVTVAPKRPGFGELYKDMLAMIAGALIAGAAAVAAFS